MAKLTDEEKRKIIMSEKFQERFWKKFNRSADKDVCWTWKGKPRKNENIYISIYINGDEDRMFAHRVSLTMKLGHIPKQDALHREEICRDKKYRCVNPYHLDDGSPKQNRIDENTAEKTIRDKDRRKQLFNEIVEKSTKSEKEFFYNILFNDLYKTE